jgi:hypothetical protein
MFWRMPSGVHGLESSTLSRPNSINGRNSRQFCRQISLNYFIFLRVFNSFQIKYSITTISGGLMMNRKKRI